MNSVLEVINQRRSVRLFEKTNVEISDLEKIINAGNMAPTGTSQSWRFVVVTEDELLNKLKELSIPYYEKFMENMPDQFKEVRAVIDGIVDDPVFYSAPAAIYVIGSGSSSDIDCSMVCQNIMLAAESLGLNSCYVYFGQLVLQNPEINSLFDLKDGEKVYGPVVLGKGKPGMPNLINKKDPIVKWL